MTSLTHVYDRIMIEKENLIILNIIFDPIELISETTTATTLRVWISVFLHNHLMVKRKLIWLL